MPREAAAGPGFCCAPTVGTWLDLPEPLRKRPALPLPARIDIPLPLGAGDIGVQLGQRVALRARAGDTRRRSEVALGAARSRRLSPGWPLADGRLNSHPWSGSGWSAVGRKTAPLPGPAWGLPKWTCRLTACCLLAAIWAACT